MGWKKLKEKFNIEHIVQINEQGVCIGSGYVSDLIVIDPATGIARESQISQLRSRYPEFFSATPQEIQSVLAEQDEFGESMKVFTYEGATILEKQCEQLGWPNVTHDGCLMFENTFSADKEQVIRWAKRNASAWVESERRTLKSYENDLIVAAGRLAESKSILEKLQADHPDEKDVPPEGNDALPLTQVAELLADKSKIYAWCQSLDKGAKRCQATGDAGDAATISDIASFLRAVAQ